MSSTAVLCLGTGDAFCSGGRLHTAFHLSTGGYEALIDCGATTIAVMRHLRMDIAALDAILVTHLHGDHFGGIPFLLLDAVYNAPRAKPLVIAGPTHTKLRLMDTLGCLYPGAPARVEEALDLRYVEYRDHSEVEVGPLRVRPFAVTHPSGATPYALRIETPGRVVAYSGDTAWTPALADAARDADLFICECFAYQNTVPHHMSYVQLRQAAPQLKARRIALTHLGDEMLRHVGELEFEVLEDGQRIEL